MTAATIASMITQIGCIYVLFRLREKYPKQIKFPTQMIDLERSIGFYTVLMISAMIGFIYLFKLYDKIPYSIPEVLIPIVDEELTMTNSIIYGINNRRKNLFLADPQNLNHKYTGSALPMLYLSACMSTGMDYPSASFIICMLNILSTGAAIYYYMLGQNRCPILGSITFLLNGSWAALRPFLGRYPVTADLISNVGRRVSIPWYQMVAVFLGGSKESSFSVPMALWAISLINNVNSKNKGNGWIASLMIILTPSFAVSFALYLHASSFPVTFSQIMPGVLSLLPKLIGVRIKYWPIWREQQMEGHFFSQIVIFFEMFGPAITWMLPSLIYDTTFEAARRDLVAWSVTGFLCFIRIGNGYFNNALAIATVVFPCVIRGYTGWLFYIIRSRKKGKTSRVTFVTLFVMSLIIYIGGGVYSMNRILTNRVPGISRDSLATAEWIKNSTNRRDVILAPPELFNPVSLAGRQTVVGPIRSVWLRGGQVSNAVSMMIPAKHGNWTQSAEKAGSHFVCVPKTTKFGGQQQLFNGTNWSVYYVK